MLSWYCFGVRLAIRPTVDSANAFFAPPLTPSKLIIACCSIDGRSAVKSLSPEAFGNTPAGPTSARTFPKRLDAERSLSVLIKEATSCLKYCSWVNWATGLSLTRFGFSFDSRAINFLCLVTSVGSRMTTILCSGASSP